MIHNKGETIMYTLEQIVETWKEVYGEDMAEEYAGFLDALQGRGHADDCEQKAIKDVLWDYISEKDIPKITERLNKLNKEGA
jgi:hypothetical protein